MIIYRMGRSHHAKYAVFRKMDCITEIKEFPCKIRHFGAKGGFFRYDKNTIRLPRQGIPFCLRPLYLLDFREIRAGIWDTFGTNEDCDMAQNSRCRLL